MANPSFERREVFHLILLRHLASRLSGRSWAVKGGIALRFFYRSPRFSGDMDLDVIRQVRSKTLEDAVDGVLGSRALLASLTPHGILRLIPKKPKQTEVTQRWDIQLVWSGGSLSTKVEFSRRRGNTIYAKGTPHSELLDAYNMPPFAAQFYDSNSMIAQKVQALAAPSRNAVRDLFDIHHLLFTVMAKAEGLSALLEAKVIENAIEKIGRFSYSDFKKQVLPYLSESVMPAYQEALAFEELKRKVEEALLRSLP